MSLTQQQEGFELAAEGPLNLSAASADSMDVSIEQDMYQETEPPCSGRGQKGAPVEHDAGLLGQLRQLDQKLQEKMARDLASATRHVEARVDKKLDEKVRELERRMTQVVMMVVRERVEEVKKEVVMARGAKGGQWSTVKRSPVASTKCSTNKNLSMEMRNADESMNHDSDSIVNEYDHMNGDLMLPYPNQNFKKLQSKHNSIVPAGMASLATYCNTEAASLSRKASTQLLGNTSPKSLLSQVEMAIKGSRLGATAHSRTETVNSRTDLSQTTGYFERLRRRLDMVVEEGTVQEDNTKEAFPGPQVGSRSWVDISSNKKGVAEYAAKGRLMGPKMVTQPSAAKAERKSSFVPGSGPPRVKIEKNGQIAQVSSPVSPDVSAGDNSFKKSDLRTGSFKASPIDDGLAGKELQDHHIQSGNFPDGTYKYTFHDGSYYLGEWRLGRIEGKGEMVWKDGDTYKGQWKNNMQEGRGIYRYKNGQVYDGEFEEDKMHGMGKYRWPDGKVYEGGWINGLQHGRGFYTNSQGVKRYGVWQHGKRTQWLPYVVRNERAGTKGRSLQRVTSKGDSRNKE